MHPLHQANILRYYLHKQRGAALMVMLIILILGAAAILVSSFSPSTLKNSRQANTATALAQAKSALISYAITYGDTHPGAHPNHTHGYLPCVDIDGKNLSGNPAEGVSDLNCGSKNISMIGRFPWKSLGLPELRDSNGECLWYAVSGTYKSNPQTDLMNWDSAGLLEVLDASGETVAQNVVAVLFAPGATLGNQNRSADGNAPICGGNYTVDNYLDNDTVHSINNSAIATGKFILPHEHHDANGNVTFTSNDQIMFITQQDIWNAIKKRNDFAGFVLSLLNTAKTCTSEPVTINFDTAPPTQTVVTVGNPRIGRIPKS